MTMLDSRPDVATTAASAPDWTASIPAPRPSRTPRVDRWLMPCLYVIAAAGGLLVGTIGFAGSYTTLRSAAAAWNFSPLIATWFPIGVDGAIVAFLVGDLVLVKRGIGWPFLRLAGHGMTAVTIILNGRAHGGAVLSSETLAHGVMPFLFSVSAEAARRLVVQAARIAAGHTSANVPAHRWMLALPATFKLWRRMKLWRIPSYELAVEMDQNREIYAARLEEKYGKSWRKTAKADEMLPFRLEAYGLSVAQALAIPEQEAEAKRQAEAAEKARKIEQEAADQERKVTDKIASTEAQIRVLDAEAKLKEAETTLAARTATTAANAGAEVATAEATAAAKATAAKMAAEAEAQALESATVAAARRKASEDEKAAADLTLESARIRKAAADADRIAADAERTTADARLAAADVERRAQALERATEEDRLAAVDARRRVVDAENAARDAEVQLNLNDVQRKARFIARIMLTNYFGDPDAMTVEAVQEALGGASHGTAVKRRAEAALLIAEGYPN